jgi:polar amino acid transport system substrate-binding protein
MITPHRAFLALVAASLVFLGGCADMNGTPGDSVRQALAPSGKLRVGLYEGSPSSVIGLIDPRRARGVGLDLGREMAERLGVPFAPVVYARSADVLAAVSAGDVDVVFTNATPERSRRIDFSGTFMDVEKGFLVAPDSVLTEMDDMLRPGLRIGVGAGGSSANELAASYVAAFIVPVASLADAVEKLSDGSLDAYASNKAILYEMVNHLPRAKVLDGHWGVEHFAIGIPKGRARGRAFVRRYAQEITLDGTVNQAIERAGLQGALAPSLR